jgi:hypothetical protein
VFITTEQVLKTTSQETTKHEQYNDASSRQREARPRWRRLHVEVELAFDGLTPFSPGLRPAGRIATALHGEQRR